MAVLKYCYISDFSEAGGFSSSASQSCQTLAVTVLSRKVHLLAAGKAMLVIF